MTAPRLGIVTASLITLSVSIFLAYTAINLLMEEPVYSTIGLLATILLVIMAVGILRGNSQAVIILSVFYSVLAVMGILISPNLPSEGLLLAISSLILASYLWKHRERPFREVVLPEASEEGSSLSEVEGGLPRELEEEGYSEGDI